MNERTKDIIIRALKTFWQAALGYIIVDINALLIGISDSNLTEGMLKTLAIGAVAAGCSAVWNSVLSPLFSSKEKGQSKEVEDDSIDNK